ncbi:hypothetical protein [Verrucosispora sp. TAA-831]|uniref:hypothetical protein n=1 Tax=Verrucosispora sp. TAA-831 TaxID=3422227 RepID=UPI003D6F2F99
MSERAYSTSDPATVAAYRAAADGFQNTARRAQEDSEALGKNKGALIRRHPLFGAEVIGLAADDPTDPPQGWRYLKSVEHLVPRRGKAGDPAREWLEEHQPPKLRAVMEQHGLPRTSRSDPNSTRYRIMSPALFDHDGTVWALYRGVIDGECTWTPRKLSEYHAAREASEDAAAALAAQVPA